MVPKTFYSSPRGWYVGQAEGGVAPRHCLCCRSQEATQQNCYSQLIWASGQMGGNAPNQFAYSFSLSPFLLLMRQALQEQGRQAPHCRGRSYGHKCLLTQCPCTHIRMHTHDPQSLTSVCWVPTWLLKGLLDTCVIYFSLGLKIKRERTTYLVIDSGFWAWFDSWELFSWLPPIYLTQYLLFKEYKVILISIVASYPPL